MITEHPNFAEIEAERIAIFARLRLFQDARQPLQLLISPSNASDGTRIQSFEPERKPTDEAESWPTLNETTGGVRCQYYVHRHDLPDGSSEYTLGCRIAWSGEKWIYEERKQRSSGWQMAVEEV